MLKKLKIAITGHAGFIGSHLAEKLVNMGHDVIGFDNNITSNHFVAGVTNMNIDLTSGELNFTDVDIVFHLAAIARIPQSFIEPAAYYHNNINSTLNVLEACRKYNVKKVIYSSSSSIYDATNPYAHSKKIGEELCAMYHELYGIDVQCLRYFNVYGPRMAFGSYATVLSKFKSNLDSNKPLIIYGTGDQRRDFTHVDDVVSANILSMGLRGFEVFDVGTGKPYSIFEIAAAFNHPINYESGFVGQAETKADMNGMSMVGYNPTHDVIDWIKNDFLC